jgi:flagellar basal-body rod protein FlgB
MLNDLTLFAMLQKQMDWLSRRQEVLSQNIANANTPHYLPKDLTPLDFKDVMKQDAPSLQVSTTDPRHVAPAAEATRFDTVTERTPEESKPNGNAVLLEEQMEKVGDVKGNYELATNLFQKNLSMLKMALGQGGGS